ncbi:2'-5' RNA ligase family protein [Undibacterium sp. CY18W]|uniref:2'-5' RNA ligase family protein n=1 Tax=Undibacterium hunanense TaxID=2762292 RepID=A0ABR6ZSZ1_9BURK|nr:2'-5' RNA ligase family protein [Undibacterium hunanense]MBC3919006.1 2'-5' RNA ligase family protein [Undibacterium hunanense]
MASIRQQLTMFVPAHAAAELEHVRSIVDPVQSSLIPAHITLCREDEIVDFSSIRQRLQHLAFPPITLTFGAPEVFLGHGLILHCIEGEQAFLQLREYILASDNIKIQRPHLTLAHPRNPKASGNSLAAAASLSNPLQISFTSIYLIEQEGTSPWRVLETYVLLKNR